MAYFVRNNHIEKERLQTYLPKTRILIYRKLAFLIAKNSHCYLPFTQVVEYLGRYTHKVAIGNHRILNINDDGVTFRWRDYRDNKEKIMTLSKPKFLRRFTQHILPKRFVRIRHYGLLSSSKRPLLRALQQSFGITPVIREKKNWKQISTEHLGYNPDLCPHCGKGTMHTIELLLPGRPPPAAFRTIQKLANITAS